MLLIISAISPGPCVKGEPAGDAPLSACKIMSNETVKIAIHLNINVIRREGRLQVIALVRSKPMNLHQ
jgi:hypothetical protein